MAEVARLLRPLPEVPFRTPCPACQKEEPPLLLLLLLPRRHRCRRPRLRSGERMRLRAHNGKSDAREEFVRDVDALRGDGELRGQRAEQARSVALSG